MVENKSDIVVVGAGAAGLMTAIWAGRTARAMDASLNILLLDTRDKIGAKILMSGGTRCNVTNKEVKPSDFEGGPSHFVKHVLQAFTPQETMQFFKEAGVELVLEPTGKWFPVTHSAQTVLDALIKEAKRVGVMFKTGARVVEIQEGDNKFHLKTENNTGRISARKVVLTTGGLSYPTTGSDGKGMDISKTLGHTIIKTLPALTPLMTSDDDWKKLSGISVNVRLSFFRDKKKMCQYQDAFLFTHFGFSGPAALDISRHFAAARKQDDPRIVVSFLPEYNEQVLAEFFTSAQARGEARQIKNILVDQFLLPARLVETLLKKSDVGPTMLMRACSRENKRRLIQSLLYCQLDVTGVYGYKKAEATAGGVDLKEVRVSTMESKRLKGLYLAGEILDVDGRIGGFNFQWAWSTGAVAGRSAARSLIK